MLFHSLLADTALDVCNDQAAHPFSNAGEALLWAVEVLRRRRLPASSPMWSDSAPVPSHLVGAARLNISAEAKAVAEHWGNRWKEGRPQDAAGRLSLALKVEDAMHALAAVNPEAAQLLRLWAWGDWADEARLRAAQAHQEKMRRQGLRVRLSYRYSTAQLALLAGCGKATLWRRLHQAQGLLAVHLAQYKVLPEGAPPPQNNTPLPKARVARADFKKGA